MSRNAAPFPDSNFFKRILRAPRLIGPAAGDPTAQTLYALVLMLLFLFTFHVGIAEIRGPRRDLVTAVGTPMFLTPIATLVLLRRNSVRAASIVFLSGLWVAFTAIIYLNGGIYHVGSAVYVALSVSAAWLFGYRGALVTAGTSLSATLVMALLDRRRAAPPHPLPGSPTGVWMLLAESILMAIVPVTLVLSSLRTALAKSQTAEAELRESEERFRRIFEEGPLGLALVGKDYRFREVNSALSQMVGYPVAELEQKTFAEITHSDDVHADIELAEQLFKGEIPSYRIQKRYVKKTGEIIWINLTASVLMGSDGEPLCGLAMIEDITEIKRTQEEALFRQKLESLGTLAGGIAHDFNNILGAVLAQAELAQGELDSESSCSEQLKAICETAMRGSEIVRQLMIYSGKERTTAGVADVSATVDEMLKLLSVSITKHAVIEAELSPDLPATRANAAQLRQIIMNLITNASEAIGDRDGVIRVRTRSVALTKASETLSSRSLPEGRYVELMVSDTGCGMSQQKQASIFDPFFTTKAAGRGLGLAVVQGIVRSLGGAIQITSEEGEGTIFQISLPCVETSAAATRNAIPIVEEPAAPANATVLVVEDEGNLREPIVKMLRKTGFDVLEAPDGSSAIDLIRAQGTQIDAILLDMTLPGASTHEIIATAVKVKPDIKVILTSAYSREAIGTSMTGPPIRSFIRKPFTLADLLKTLRNSLST